jgi:hypothetical protein
MFAAKTIFTAISNVVYQFPSDNFQEPKVTWQETSQLNASIELLKMACTRKPQFPVHKKRYSDSLHR